MFTKTRAFRGHVYGLEKILNVDTIAGTHKKKKKKRLPMVDLDKKKGQFFGLALIPGDKYSLIKKLFQRQRHIIKEKKFLNNP